MRYRPARNPLAQNGTLTRGLDFGGAPSLQPANRFL
jgi:hypothetical protein